MKSAAVRDADAGAGPASSATRAYAMANADRLRSTAMPPSRIAFRTYPANGQHARAGQRPQHHRADRYARIPGEPLHVEQRRLPGAAASALQLRRIEPAIAHRHLFRQQKYAMRGADQRRSIRRHEPEARRPRRFRQLARQDDIDLAGDRRQRENRRAAGPIPAADLDVVGRTARALGDAGHRGRLHGESPARAAATIHPVSTPPPSPPIAKMSRERGFPPGCRAVSSMAENLNTKHRAGKSRSGRRVNAQGPIGGDTGYVADCHPLPTIVRTAAARVRPR